MAEVHIVGQILGASGFEQQNLFCKWGVVVGHGWRLLEGYATGRTQIDHPVEEGEMSVWAHPIDLHYATSSISGWPKIHFQVNAEDSFGRKELAGYGFCFLPTVVGEYNLEVATWKPAGSKWLDATESFFLGGGPQLVHDELVYKQDDRFRLCGESTGIVHLEVGVVLKDFEKHGVEVHSTVPQSMPERSEDEHERHMLGF